MINIPKNGEKMQLQTNFECVR